MIKLLMTWNIQEGHERAYFEFMVREFTPTLLQMGIELREAWYTVYGDGPQILIGWLVEDRETVQKVMETEEWQGLYERLLEHVTDFQFRVVPPQERFQV